MSRSHDWGVLADGTQVTAHELGDGDTVQVTVLSLGATLQRLVVPTPGGRPRDVVLGYDDLASYLDPANDYQGAVVGRYANRVAGSRFTLDDVEHHLVPNDGAHCLHGGPDGFHRRAWSVLDVGDRDITLRLVSPAGDQGFPGELVATATYRVEEHALTLEVAATTDAPTVVSLAPHAYLNLAGTGRGSIDDHVLTVDADEYIPVDDTLIPSRGCAPVSGTPFDLTSPTRLGDRLRSNHPQLRRAGGIDHAFVSRGSGFRRVARLEHPWSGLAVEVHSDQPSLQVYTGNFLDGRTTGRGGRALRQGDGIALETQRPPDAPNQPGLGASVLRPGEVWESTTRWEFSWSRRARS